MPHADETPVRPKPDRSGIAVEPPGEDQGDEQAPVVRTAKSAQIGPLSERTESAMFHEGGLPGRAMGDTLLSISGLYTDDDLCVARKATFGTSALRSNGNEFSADLTETITFRDGTTVVLRGRANLSAFERRDADIVLEVVAANGALAGWSGRQVTSRTEGPPSRSRSTRFELNCTDPTDAGSGPDQLVCTTTGVLDPAFGPMTLDVRSNAGPINLRIDSCDAGASECDIAGAVYVVATPAGVAMNVYGARLPAHLLPTGGGDPGARSKTLVGFLVRPTPRAQRRGTVTVGEIGGHLAAMTVTVPQAGGPELIEPLDCPDRIAWGVDRGELELSPLGVIGRLADA